jgi:hypothetical protein
MIQLAILNVSDSTILSSEEFDVQYFRRVCQHNSSFTFSRLTWRRIRNPLVGVPQEALFEDVEAFATENGLTDILPLLKRGALLAQDPLGFESIEGLEDNERHELELEQTNRWHQPRTLYLTIVLNSIAAAIQGWDQTGSLFSYF